MKQQIPKEMRELGKYDINALNSLKETLSSPGLKLLWTIFEDKTSLLKDVEFSSKYSFQDVTGAVLFGNRHGQVDMMQYVRDLKEKINSEIVERGLDK